MKIKGDNPQVCPLCGLVSNPNGWEWDVLKPLKHLAYNWKLSAKIRNRRLRKSKPKNKYMQGYYDCRVDCAEELLYIKRQLKKGTGNE